MSEKDPSTPQIYRRKDFLGVDEDAASQPNRTYYFRKNVDPTELVEACTKKLEDDPDNVQLLHLLQRNSLVPSSSPSSSSSSTSRSSSWLLLLLLLITISYVHASVSSTYSLSNHFSITIDGLNDGKTSQDKTPFPSISISTRTSPDDDAPASSSGRLLWLLKSCTANTPFLSLGKGTLADAPIKNGNSFLSENTIITTQGQSIDDLHYSLTSLTILGRLYATQAEASYPPAALATYTLTFNSSQYKTPVTAADTGEIVFGKGHRLFFELLVMPLAYTSASSPPPPQREQRVLLRYASSKDEALLGFGEQFSYLNFKGKVVPILVSEQGLGRGEEPVTSYINNKTRGGGGDWGTTYAPRPAYLSNKNIAFVFTGSQVSVFDLRRDDEIAVELWAGSSGSGNGSSSSSSSSTSSSSSSSTWSGVLCEGKSVIDLIQSITSVTGRQDQVPLPAWTQTGAIIGLEAERGERGASSSKNTNAASVIARTNELLKGGTPIAGVWLQDWVGLQHFEGPEGDRLIWNWQLNLDYYPDWQYMVSQWREQQNIRVLTYVSPFFSNASAVYTQQQQQQKTTEHASTSPHFSSHPPPPRRNFFQEGVDNRYFVQKKQADQGEDDDKEKEQDQTYLMNSISIVFAMLDLTNPQAVTWMKNIIKQQMLEEAGSSGFMCDFGEYLPFYDAALFQGSAATYHNKYPEAWAQLAAEAIREVKQEQEVFFFVRSAWTHSPSYVPVFWLGDQLASFDGNDGLRSAITGAISGGLTGQAITHADIGGYNVILGALGAGAGVQGTRYVRDEELLARWTEWAAFGNAIFRTHIGTYTSSSNSSSGNMQVFSNDETIAHFAKFAKIFAHLASYRRSLLAEAANQGLPLMRPLFLHFQNDLLAWSSWPLPHLPQQQNTPTQTQTIQDENVDTHTHTHGPEYLFGADFLIAPCVWKSQTTAGGGRGGGGGSTPTTTKNDDWTEEPGNDDDAADAAAEGAKKGTNVYFPAESGVWVHLWSGVNIDAGSPPPLPKSDHMPTAGGGTRGADGGSANSPPSASSTPATGLMVYGVPSPIGFPAVFFKQGSIEGTSLRAFVVKNDMDKGFPSSWTYDNNKKKDKVGVEAGKRENNSSKLPWPLSLLFGSQQESGSGGPANLLLVGVVGVVGILWCLLVWAWMRKQRGGAMIIVDHTEVDEEADEDEEHTHSHTHGSSSSSSSGSSSGSSSSAYTTDNKDKGRSSNSNGSKGGSSGILEMVAASTQLSRRQQEQPQYLLVSGEEVEDDVL